MAGAGTKRIVDLTETSEVQSGDYIAIDSTARGTKKTPVSVFAKAADLTAEQTARAAADTELDGKITAETTARANAIEAEQTAREQTDAKVADLKSDFNYKNTIPKQLTISDYVNTLEMAYSVMTERVIPAGSYIDSVTVYSGTNTSSTAYVYLFNESNVCIEKKSFTCVNGKNVIPFGVYVDVNCKLGVYGASPLYKTGAVPTDCMWSQGLYSISPKEATRGNSVTTTQSFASSKFSLAVFALVYSGVTKKTTILDSEADYNSKVIPDVWEALTLYNTAVSGSAFVVSGIEFPSGSLIKAIRYYSTSASPNVYLYVIDKTTSKVKYHKYTSAVLGWNTETINYLCDSNCIIGIYGAVLVCRKDTAASGVINSRKVFSTGLLTADIKPAKDGDVLTITQTDSSNVYALPIQVEYTSSITAYWEMRNVVPANPTCYASFIDDDSGTNTPSLWGEIIENTGIRMGFACITGVMAGAVEPTIQTVPMGLSELKALYNAGHEVYSHSWDHRDFEYATTTPAIITEECYKSKDWLLANGFYRGSNIIVYPGGMGEATTPKQNAVKQFFEYGVDAWGGGLNPLPIKKTRIARINADTSTLESMKASVDLAVAYKCLIVFMNHSYEMISDRDAQVEKMEALIGYIQSKGVEILPLGEALNRIYR